MPYGCPPPSQCSSKLRIAATTPSEKRILRAISAPRSQRVSINSLRDLAAVLEDVDQRAKPLGQTRLHAGVRQHETQHLRQAVVDGMEVAFEGDVVDHIELADARRVTAATDVLHQQRVIEFPDFGFGQADLAADMDADPAAADAMAGRLAFHHVERVAQRAEQFGEAELRPGSERSCDVSMDSRPIPRPAVLYAGALSISG